MKMYITGVGCVAAQYTGGDRPLLETVHEYAANRLPCVEPDYSKYIEPATLRRMTAISRYGLAAGMIALKDANVETPGAIITGTGYGLLESSEKFLKSMIESGETLLSPTAFMQSTHNSVSAAIALKTNCTSYNNTFSQKAFSFESALLDATMFMADTAPKDALVGTYEGMGDVTFSLLEKLGVYRAAPCINLDIIKSNANGLIAGEGASFFVFSAQPQANTYGVFLGCHTFYEPEDGSAVSGQIAAFITEHNIAITDIDLVLSGICGDRDKDRMLIELNNNLFAASSVGAFKHLCGEYMTASSFAFWLAARIMKDKLVPPSVLITNNNRAPKTVLIHNVFGNYHSVILLQAC